MAKERESTDYLNTELNVAIDFMHLSSGGLTVQPVTEREFDMTTAEGKLAYEKFMRDPVVIRLHPTGDPNEADVADVKLNGVPCPMPRGKPIRLPRAFVEALAQSQVRTYRQERDPNPDAPEGMKTRRQGGANFPFSVIEDRHPKGRAWLERVIHTAA